MTSPNWYSHGFLQYDIKILLQTSFPKDKIRPGFFFKDVAEHTDDGFFYVILPVKKVDGIPNVGAILSLEMLYIPLLYLISHHLRFVQLMVI